MLNIENKTRIELVSALAVERGVRLTPGQDAQAFAGIWNSFYPDKICPTAPVIRDHVRQVTWQMLQEGLSGQFPAKGGEAEFCVNCIILGTLAYAGRSTAAAQKGASPALPVFTVRKQVLRKMEAWNLLGYFRKPESYVNKRLREYANDTEVILPGMLNIPESIAREIIRTCRFLGERCKAAAPQAAAPQAAAPQAEVPQATAPAAENEAHGAKGRLVKRMVREVMVSAIVDTLCFYNEDAPMDSVEAYRESFMRVGHELFAPATEDMLGECFRQLLEPKCRTQDMNKVLLLNGGLETIRDQDCVFLVVAVRALYYAIAEAAEHSDCLNTEEQMDALIETAARQCREFAFEGIDDDRLARELKDVLRKNYALRPFIIPAEIIDLLRKLGRNRQLEILDFYAQQNSFREKEKTAEIERRMQEVHAEYGDIRVKAEYDVKRRLLQCLSSVENDTLGFLYRLAQGEAFQEDMVRYTLRGLFQELQSFGITPTDEVLGAVIQGGEQTQHICDVYGYGLASGKEYRMIKTGWRIDGELAINPVAEDLQKTDEDPLEDGWQTQTHAEGSEHPCL